MSATLNLLLEVEHPETGSIPASQVSYHICRKFTHDGITTDDLLNEFESLLRAAGYHCSHETLTIVAE